MLRRRLRRSIERVVLGMAMTIGVFLIERRLRRMLGGKAGKSKRRRTVEIS
jgi:hypothetical protein